MLVAPSLEAAQSADLSVQKTDSADPVGRGSNFSYTITVHNNGPNNANSTILTDPLPAGVTFVSATTGCSLAAGTVTCDLGNINVNVDRIVTITVTAPNAAVLLSNTASAVCSITDPNTANNSDTETTLVENAPVANNDSYSVNEDTTLNVSAPGVLGNDTDVENDPLTAILVSGPASGNLTLNANGSFSYTPASNFNGPITFTYKANDGFIDSNTATVTITVNPINDVPVANSQSVSTNEDTNVGITLTASDVDGDSLSYIVVSNPSHGNLTGTAPNLTYHPNANYNGPDSFTFKANDGQADSNVATVSITVNAANDAPVANDQSVSTNEDTNLGITLTASDADGDSLNYIVVSNPSHGNLTGTAPNLTYHPDANYNGPDSFTFKANDGQADSNVATVSITVNGANDDPVANDQSVSTNEDSNLGITLTASDADGDSLNYIVVSNPSHGSLTGTVPNVTYNPDPNYNGPDSFTFKANDGQADSNVATVSITVNAANDAPVANDQSVSTNEDTNIGITLTASDPDGDSLNYIVVSNPSHGSLTGTAPNVTYNPDSNYNGPDSFTFKANDGQADSNVATVSITVTATNDDPVANDQSVSTNEDTNVGITLTGSDADGDSLNYIVVSNPSHGSLTGTAPNVTYNPDPNYNGADSFTFKANDGQADSNVATVSITVNAANDDPVANDQSVSTNEDTNLGVTLTASDVDGDSLSYIVVSNPAHGNLTGTAPNLTYHPDANYNGSDSFTFKANDSQVDSNIATVSINIAAVNDEPVANDQSVSTNEDTDLGITLTASDADGDSLSYSVESNPSHGTLSGTAPNLTYHPDANYNGPDSFTFKANDGQGDSNVATIGITVNAEGDAPVAVADSYNVDEDQTLTVNTPGVLTNDSDNDGDPLTAVLQSDVAHGTLNLNANGSFTYTPTADFNGTDSFTYAASDGSSNSNTVIVTIIVNAVNDVPVAKDDNYNVNEDSTLNIPVPGVLSNDTDADNDALTVSIVSNAQHGNVTLNADGSFLYTPDAEYSGTDTFTYSASDSNANSNTATVTITVDAVNDSPVAGNDSYSVNEDTTLTVPASGVLGNDTDPDGDPLTASLQSNVSHGTLTFNANGAFVYTPNSNFNGFDSFTYMVSDGNANSNIATVLITVNAVNDNPAAGNDSYSVNEDQTLTVNAAGVLTNDSDVDGDALIAVLQNNVAHGTLTLNANGSLTYKPAADFNGSDSFTYAANDGTANSNFATVTITVTAVNDAPVANADSYVANEDVALDVPAANGVLSNDTDAEDDSLSAVGLTNPQHGTLTLNANGSFTYTPNADFNGNDSFTYKANDGNTDSNATTVTINVAADNDAPVASDDSAETDQDVAVTVDVLSNDSDVDGDTLITDSVSDPANGTTAINGDGTITYTPDSGFFGTDSFTYTIKDGNGGNDSASVNITVNQVIPPVSLTISDVTALEPLTGSVTATLTVTLSATSASDVTVDFATADGTATAGSDYTANSGTITIPAGSTTASIDIEILADANAFEGNETVMVNLSNASGAVITDNQGVVTITETCLFCDDFEDGVLSTDWTYVKQSWNESNGGLHGTPLKRKAITVANPAFSGGCTTCSISATMNTAGGSGNRVWMLGWYIDKKNTVEVLMKEEVDKWTVKQRVNGRVVSKGKGLATILPNVSYNVEIRFDGTNFELRVDGNLLATVPAKAAVPSGTVGFAVKNTTGNFGYILVN